MDGEKTSTRSDAGDRRRDRRRRGPRHSGPHPGQDGVAQGFTVDSSGKVEASITTKNLAVSGMLVGNVTASERVEVRKEGKMVGDIKAPRVVIADGAKFKGNIEMGVD